MKVGDLVKLKSQWTASSEPILGVIVMCGKGTMWFSGMVRVHWTFNDDLVWMDTHKMELIPDREAICK